MIFEQGKMLTKLPPKTLPRVRLQWVYGTVMVVVDKLFPFELKFQHTV
jgi:hypothetical protein